MPHQSRTTGLRALGTFSGGDIQSWINSINSPTAVLYPPSGGELLGPLSILLLSLTAGAVYSKSVRGQFSRPFWHAQTKARGDEMRDGSDTLVWRGGPWVGALTPSGS